MQCVPEYARAQSPDGHAAGRVYLFSSGKSGHHLFTPYPGFYNDSKQASNIISLSNLTKLLKFKKGGERQTVFFELKKLKTAFEQ